MRRFALLSLLISIAATVSAQYPGSIPPPDDLKPGFDAIKISDAKGILTFLATQCEGRGTGQPGFEKAAQFVARQFQSIGLKPLGDNGTFFQRTTFTRVRYAVNGMTVTGTAGELKLGRRDLTLSGGPDSVAATGPVSFVQYKGRRASLPASADFTGRVVFLSGDEPNNRLAFGCLRAGAAAVFTSSDALSTPTWRARMGDQPPTATGITGAISTAALKKIVDSLHATVATADAADSVAITPIDGKITVKGTREVQKVQVGNVVGLMEGSDPALKNEYVGIGGHLDHLGINNGVVYPGADDDGSGSTSVIEIAKAMAANPKKPRRSLVFMTFFGEEMGLLGSRFLTQHPPIPLDKMVAELQMDMVGRDSDGIQNGDRSRVDVASENIDTIRLVGSKRISTELDKTIQDMNRYVNFRFKYDAEDVYTRSDHYNFAAKGIPIAFLFDGFHPDYHQPTDTVDKIDWEKLTNSARLYYLTAHAVADADAPPKKDVVSKGS